MIGVTRTKTVGIGVVLLGALALGGCSDDGDGGGGERIVGYDVVLEAAQDGSMRVTETIDYDFADSDDKHGLIRSIPRRGPATQDQDREYPITDVQVTSPTGAPVDLERDADGRDLQLRIGDESEEVSGEQTYQIGYTVEGVVDAVDGGERLGWNAVGTEWDVPIDEVTVSLSGPADVTAGTCRVGEDGEDGATCEADSSGGVVVAGSTDLAAGEGVAVTGDFPAGTFATTQARLVDTWSPAQAFTANSATIAAALALLALLAAPAVLAARRRDDAADGSVGGVDPFQLTPPDDARPGQLGTLYDEFAGAHEVNATLLDLAVRGYLRVEEASAPTDEDDPEADDAESDDAESDDPESDDPGSDDAPPSKDDDPDAEPEDWVLIRTPNGPDELRPYERHLLKEVFKGVDEIRVSDLRSRFSTISGEVRAKLYTDVVDLGWFHADPSAVRTRAAVRGGLILAAGAVATVLLAIWTTWALAGLGIVAAGILTLLLCGATPVRTATGSDVLARTRAFRTSLEGGGIGATDDERPDRDALSGAQLPYAVALGVQKKWHEALVALNRPPQADWYAGSGANSFVYWPAIMTFSSGSGSAWTPPASSGSGVGGVSAGGGGGGSW